MMLRGSYEETGPVEFSLYRGRNKERKFAMIDYDVCLRRLLKYWSAFVGRSRK